jgi:hypothetical protein
MDVSTATAEPVETRPMLDLRYTHAVLPKGDIVAILTWDRHSGDGCLVLVPNRANLDHQTVMPCIVQEQNAWIWSDTIGSIVDQESIAAQFACALGLPPEPRSIHKVMSIVRDLVGDLANMPAMPDDAGAAIVADVFSRDTETGAETHLEVVDHV